MLDSLRVHVDLRYVEFGVETPASKRRRHCVVHPWEGALGRMSRRKETEAHSERIDPAIDSNGGGRRGRASELFPFPDLSLWPSG